MHDGEFVTPASEWFLDNYHLISSEIAGIREHLPRQFYKQLPALAAREKAGGARIYAIAVELLRHSDGRLDVPQLTQFLNSYQRVAPLTFGELWAWPKRVARRKSAWRSRPWSRRGRRRNGRSHAPRRMSAITWWAKAAKAARSTWRIARSSRNASAVLPWATPLVMAIAALLLAIPTSDLALAITQRLVTLAVPPGRLPRLDLTGGVPDDARTMVVVPTLITSVDNVQHRLEHLEVVAIGNLDPHIHFALLTDSLTPTCRRYPAKKWCWPPPARASRR